MKKFTPFWQVIFIVPVLFLSGCETGNRADLSRILSPASLPYLKTSKLIQVSSYDTSGGNEDRITIAAGKKAVIFDADGPGMITRIWLTVDSRDPYYLRHILIRMYWDNEPDPSVEVPLGDFFGCGFEYKQWSSPYLGMTSGGYICFFPMPFEKKARIEVENQTGEELYALYYQIDYHKFEGYLDRDVGYFHATWNRSIRTDYDSNYVLLKTEGNGHIVGVIMNLQSYDGYLSYLEGDEMIYVDGEKRPSISGTGTEDYFSSGWYFNQGEYNAPYNGLIYKNDSLGRITAYRFHITDPIPFRKSIKFTFEHGNGNKEIADYSSTIFWYELEPQKKFHNMLKSSLRTPLRCIVPNDIIEAEDLDFRMEKIPHRIMDMTGYGPEWSQGKQLFLSTKKGDEFSLDLSDLKEATYDITLYYTKGPGYGNTTIWSGGKKIGDMSAYDMTVIPSGIVMLKNVAAKDEKIALVFRVEGKSPNSFAFYTGLDGIRLKPLRSYIPDWLIIGPFPNPRVTEKIRLGLDSLYPPEQDASTDKVYFTSDRKPITWNYVKTPENGYLSLYDKIKPNELVVAYALTWLYSPVDQPVSLFVGSDDGMKVFFNGKQVYRFLGIRVAEPDQAEIPLNVKKGWNELLLKIENNLGGYAFYARVADRQKNIVFSPKKKYQNFK